MIQPLDQSIIELLNASRDDEQTFAFPLNDRSFGFHAQQAIEKLIKALIGGHRQKYTFTHDLEQLVIEVQALSEKLPVDPVMLVKLTDYAGIWRYQEPEALLPEQRANLKQAVVNLRAYTLSRLAVLRPDVDWTAFT
jgi:hypothetical protein